MDYSQEPLKPDALVVQGIEPFNAEPEASALVEFELTPSDLVYCRNHGPVRVFDEDKYVLTVKGAVNNDLQLKMKDIRSMFEKTAVVAALQVSSVDCNRREIRF